MQFTPQQKKIAIGAGAVILVLILVAIFLRSNSNTVTVNVAVAPSDSTLTLDGKTIQPGSVTLTKGQHTFKASRKDFGDATKTINTADIDPKQTIYVLPTPNSDQAKQYLSDNPSEQMTRERGIAVDVSNAQETLITKYPVVQYLPHETTDYKIDYEVDSNKNPVFTVTLYTSYPTPDNQATVNAETDAFKKEAQQFLKDNGVDIDKVTIHYNQG